MSYAEYMASPEWELRKKRYFANHRRVCEACESTEKIHLHHLSYVRMCSEPDSDLVPLCETCHATVHRMQRLTKSNLKLSTKKTIKQLRKQRLRTQPEREAGVAGHQGSQMDRVFRYVADSQKEKSASSLSRGDKLSSHLRDVEAFRKQWERSA